MCIDHSPNRWSHEVFFDEILHLLSWDDPISNLVIELPQIKPSGEKSFACFGDRLGLQLDGFVFFLCHKLLHGGIARLTEP